MERHARKAWAARVQTDRHTLAVHGGGQERPARMAARATRHRRQVAKVALLARDILRGARRTEVFQPASAQRLCPDERQRAIATLHVRHRYVVERRVAHRFAFRLEPCASCRTDRLLESAAGLDIAHQKTRLVQHPPLRHGHVVEQRRVLGPQVEPLQHGRTKPRPQRLAAAHHHVDRHHADWLGRHQQDVPFRPIARLRGETLLHAPEVVAILIGDVHVEQRLALSIAHLDLATRRNSERLGRLLVQPHRPAGTARRFRRRRANDLVALAHESRLVRTRRLRRQRFSPQSRPGV